jgi:co-chaperonin GroES (HSP10)
MRSEQFKPYGNLVFLRIDKRREQVGHIHLPGEKTGIEQVGYSTAHIMAVGPGRFEQRKVAGLDEGQHFYPREHLSPGDQVIIRDYHQDLNPIEVDDEGVFVVIHFADLVAVVPEGTLVGAWSEIGDLPA